MARRCSERCWKKSFSRVGVAGRCRRKSGTCWIEWSSWWPDYPLFSQSAVVLSEPAVDVDQDLACPLRAGGAEGGLGLVEGELGADQGTDIDRPIRQGVDRLRERTATR